MRFYTFVLAFVASILGSFTGAFAFDCGSLVVDNAGLLQGNTTGIATAARQLTNLGATVHVWTVSDYGSTGSIDAYEKSIRQACPAWQDTSGGLRSGMVLFFVEKAHHRLGLYYGDQWRSALDTQFQTITTAFMVPHLKDGDTSAAFVAGIGEVTRLVDLQVHPPKTTGTVIVKNEGPAVDYSGVWKMFLWIVLLGAAAIGGAFMFVRRSRSQNDNRAAKQAAETIKASCATALTAFDQATKAILTAKVVQAKGVLGDQDAQALDRQLTSVTNGYDSASAEFARLDGIASNDPSQPKLSAAEYQQITAVYKALLQKFSAADKDRQQLEADVSSTLAAAESAPRKIVAAKAAVANLATSIATLGQDGFKVTDLKAACNSQTVQIAAAEQAVAQKQLGTAAKQADAVLAAVNEIATAATSLRQQQRDAIDQVQTVRNAMPGAEQALAEAGQIVAGFAGVYVQTSWAQAKQDLDAASVSLKTVKSSLDVAEKAAAKDVLDLALVKSSLSAANRVIRQATSVAVAAQELRDTLAAAKQGAAESVKSAQSACDDAEGTVSRYASDSDGQPATALRKARERLSDARAKLAVTMPDYVAVQDAATSAAKQAEQASALARSQHGQAERRRQDAIDAAAAAERRRLDQVRRERDQARRERDQSRTSSSNDGFVTGLVVGELLSNNNGSSHHHSSSGNSSPGSDNGGSTDWGSSGSDNGGSVDTSSPGSDNGGSTGW